MSQHEAIRRRWAPSRARARSWMGPFGQTLGPTLGWTLALGGLAACGGERDPPGPATVDAKASEAPAATTPDAARWRFVPTLEQHLPAGAVGVPVLELSRPRQRSVTILAAVLRAGAEHVELERWTFTQSADGQSLQLVTGGEVLVRLRPGPGSPALAELRREVAAPSVVLTRPVGLAAEARGTIDALTTALATMRDANAEPRARVEATAAVVRGVDDTVVFDRDAIWEVAELLGTAPTTIEVEAISPRRARATLAHATLELQRKSDGWAIVAIERTKPTTLPDPSSSPQ